jgi:hypothetical protein
MTFDHLSNTEFEELIYDLLVALGFKNVNWRRGTGQGGFVADQGRDIVAQEMRTSIDGEEHLETWFVQCKHYVKGVPPEKLHDALAWSNAERPHVLQFAVSNFLSNPAKNHLEIYERNNKPPYRIKLWERKNLERLISARPQLIRRYKLEPFDACRSADSNHLMYVLSPPSNSLVYFFEQVEKMNPSMRDEIFLNSYHSVINPRYREPSHKCEKIKELRLDDVDYQAFKARCFELQAIRIQESFLVQSIVTEALSCASRFSDEPGMAAATVVLRDTLSTFEAELAAASDPEEIEINQSIVDMLKRLVRNAPDRQRSWKEYYRYMCEAFVPALLIEDSARGKSARDV